MIEIYAYISFGVFVLLTLMCAASVREDGKFELEDIFYIGLFTIFWPTFIVVLYMVIRDHSKQHHWRMF